MKTSLQHMPMELLKNAVGVSYTRRNITIEFDTVDNASEAYREFASAVDIFSNTPDIISFARQCLLLAFSVRYPIKVTFDGIEFTFECPFITELPSRINEAVLEYERQKKERS